MIKKFMILKIVLILDFVDIDESELIKNSKLSFDEFDIKLNENLD